MANKIAINARFYSHRLTGMQRYGAVLAERFQAEADCIRPATPMKGMKGHLWEQVRLPMAARGKLLWSPNNTGPITVSNQVCTIHDLIPLDRPEWFSPKFSAWYKWLLPKLVRRVAHIIAISEFTKGRIVDSLGVKPERVTVVPNGVDAAAQLESNALEDVRAKLGITSRNYLLCLGSLEPRKNVKRLVDAWGRIQPRLPDDLQLVIAGGQASSQVFAGMELGGNTPGVAFTGYVNDGDLPALYAGALALVYPSLYEGFGLPPLEAMAYGTPVITSNTTSLPEVVGSDALLVDPENVEELGAAMERMVLDTSLRQSLSARGRERSQAYSWDKTARLTWQILAAHAS